ncbi:MULTISPECIES: hypothetical protein [unclassified Dysgonomonas]|uniref:hypothetical protein n=1 Tax=unclassified Dysgonomonas TaxID=2630389 RepID=UPI0024753B6A|nr:MULTISPECIES: hypothetical protein [unclassified Dysgonomonas]
MNKLFVLLSVIILLGTLFSCRTTKNITKYSVVDVNVELPLKLDMIERGKGLAYAVPASACNLIETVLNEPLLKKAGWNNYTGILYEAEDNIYWGHVKLDSEYNKIVNTLYKSERKEYDGIQRALNYLDRQTAVDLVTAAIGRGADSYIPEPIIKLKLDEDTSGYKVSVSGLLQYSNHWAYELNADGERKYYLLQSQYTFDGTIETAVGQNPVLKAMKTVFVDMQKK